MTTGDGPIQTLGRLIPEDLPTARQINITRADITDEKNPRAACTERQAIENTR